MNTIAVYSKNELKALQRNRRQVAIHRQKSLRKARKNVKVVDTNIFKVITIFSVIVAISIFAAAYIGSKLHSQRLLTMREEIYELNRNIDQLESQLKTERVQAAEQYQAVTDVLSTVSEIAYELDQENQQLVEQANELQKKIIVYEEREELYDSYEYALMREDGTRTDITYERINDLKSLAEEKNLSEDVVDLVLGLTMTESRGTETAKNSESTATGFGQLLEGTARFCYEKLMGNGSGTYKHSMALDGDTNLAMMTYYLDYLNDKYSGNMDSVIKEYRGLSDPEYKQKLNQYLAKAGTDLNSIVIRP